MAAFSKVGIKPDIIKLLTAAFDAGCAAVNKRDQQHRDTKYFHASSAGYCILDSFMNAKYGKGQDLKFLRKVNFGTAIHTMYQTYLSHSGKLFGLYFCKKCGKTFGPQYADVCDCKDGKKKLKEYSELRLLNNTLRISGHPDGFMNLGSKIYLIEIKTISPFYKIATGPEIVDKSVSEHKRQCNLYLGLLRHKDTKFAEMDREVFLANVDLNEYILAYHDKGSDDMVPYKFAYSEEVFQKDCLRIQRYHTAIELDVPPEGEPELKKCKYCAWINQCAGLTT